MAHYAKIENTVVTDVIVADQEFVDTLEGTWVQTSFNTRQGKWVNPDTLVEDPNKTPLRKNYASIGYTYDAQRDAFIPPRPFESWVLNEETCGWEPPTPKPNDIEDENHNVVQFYWWNEETLSWELKDVDFNGRNMFQFY